MKPKANPDGLRGKLLRFFKDNPDEELSRADIAVKFDAGQHNVDATLTRMRLLGEVEPIHVWRKARSAVDMT